MSSIRHRTKEGHDISEEPVYEPRYKNKFKQAVKEEWDTKLSASFKSFINDISKHYNKVVEVASDEEEEEEEENSATYKTSIVVDGAQTSWKALYGVLNINFDKNAMLDSIGGEAIQAKLFVVDMNFCRDEFQTSDQIQ